MKTVIPNIDPDYPEATKEIAPVELDLSSPACDEGEKQPPRANPFVDAINSSLPAEQKRRKEAETKFRVRAAQMRASEEFRAVAARLTEETGVPIGHKQPWAYSPKPKAAYELWKRVIPMFLDQPETLEIGPTALVQRLNGGQDTVIATRDMLYASLNRFARSDLARRLSQSGVALRLKKPTSIRSVQKQLLARRNAAENRRPETFACRVTIDGSTATINGKEYAIQLSSSGTRRVKIGGRAWLPLDTLRTFCMPDDDS